MQRTVPRGIGLLVAVAWLVLVAVTGTIAARAVAVLDSGSGRAAPLSPQEVTAALAAARAAAATPSPSATPTPPGQAPPPSPTATATAPASQVVRTWAVAGGEVAVACSGDSISLLYATPSDGWTVDVGSAGPQRVEVELTQNGRETKVGAVCAAGVPERSVQERTDG